MGNIIILDEITANQIAAGEVVERPSSIAKELIENSVDAGATKITIQIEKGGVSLLKITDNGSGIARDDIEIAFERHATSKIKCAKDLDVIASFGFRGEALASIASVSSVELVTRTAIDDTATKILVRGGNIISKEETGAGFGTTITIQDLFYNTPARYKFLKKDYTEAGYIEDIVSKIALINPKISFKYINQGKTIFMTSGDGDIQNTIYQIFGKDIAKSIIPFNANFENINISGVLGEAKIARSNRANEIFYVNGRYIKNKTIASALENAYQTVIPIGKFPFAVIDIRLDSGLVDVNVHPAKTEVRFSDESLIYRAVYHTVKGKILQKDLVEEVTLPQKRQNIETSEKPAKIIEPSYTPKPLQKENGLKEVPKKSSAYTYSSASYQPKDYFVKTPTSYIRERNESLFSMAKAEEVKKNYRVIGVAFLTYIIIEQEGNIYIIDQHAAHERVMYEKLLKKVSEGVKNKQMLMIPEVIELKESEVKIVQDNMELFNKTGFEIEEFGTNTVKISAVPSEISKISIRDLFLDILDSLQKETGVLENDKSEYFIFTMACKAAVKANMKLNIIEIEALTDEMMKLQNPFTCPHGRPTAIKLTKEELEKKFKRR